MCDQPQKQGDSLDQMVDQTRRGRLDRRGLLRRAVALGLSSSAAYQLLGKTQAAAQDGPSGRQYTTLRHGEEGSHRARLTHGESSLPHLPTHDPHPPGRVTTYAIGEEGNPTPTAAVGENGRPPVTTQAVGEEGGSPPKTLAVGEEAPTCPTPRPTTYRVGEESSVTTRAWGEESTGRPTPTTLAVGEEGGKPISRPTPPATTQAVGEEGGVLPRFSEPSGIRNVLPQNWKSFRRW
ncbi:hypothetical protein FYK55_01205 [Roseiconus nitratireducens]|uniref:Uncharacterized protein n=1 Tax=Roseiconus nitratireducens TaxID=2605748 RepID=A0A5M6DNQ2_9BACT|nr:hypothetical protein [Roseiconus nitratireducens]KAA5547065.1 hypothetical protein FYK55_01205 [Roseiconus nitratireducens]